MNLTTDTGAVQVSYLLDPWGHIRGQAGNSINRHIFTDQEYDQNTGLIYFGARYYDPDTARFLTQDAYLGETDTPPSLNRYLYAYSNPMVFIDLMGYAPATSDAAEFLHGLVKSQKETVAGMNDSEMMRSGFFGELGTRTAAALIGIGGGLIEMAAGGVDIVDLSVDAQIAQTPILKNTAIGQDSQKRLEQTGETIVATAKAAWNYITTESFSGMAEKAVEKTKDFFEKTFVEGELSHTASWSSAMFQVTFAGAQIAKGQKAARLAQEAAKAAEAAGETAEAVTQTVRTAGRAATETFAPGEIMSSAKIPETTPITDPSRVITQGRVPSAGGAIRSFTQETDEIYYRVYSTKQQGSFLTKVPPRSRAWAQEALSLPPDNEATLIQKVRVPAGTRLQRSRALPAFGHRGGAEQFQLLERLSEGNFSEGVLFK